MTPRPRSMTAHTVERALIGAGFHAIRQSGSHRIYEHNADRSRRVVATIHASRDLKPGTLRAIIRQAGLGVEEFIALL